MIEAIVTGVVIGLVSPIMLGLWSRHEGRKTAEKPFLTIRLTCSRCGHEGAFARLDKPEERLDV